MRVVGEGGRAPSGPDAAPLWAAVPAAVNAARPPQVSCTLAAPGPGLVVRGETDACCSFFALRLQIHSPQPVVLCVLFSVGVISVWGRPARCGGSHAAFHPRLSAPAPPRGKQPQGFLGLRARCRFRSDGFDLAFGLTSPAGGSRSLAHAAAAFAGPLFSTPMAALRLPARCAAMGVGSPVQAAVLTSFHRQIIIIITPRANVCTRVRQFAHHEVRRRRIAAALRRLPAAISSMLSIGACRRFCRRIVRAPS